MMKAKGVILGCGGLILLVFLLIVGGVVFMGYLAKDVEGVAATINSPAEVMVGESFDLEVVVRNERSGKVLRLSDVDIADEYLAGFTISSVKPKPKSEMHVPIDNAGATLSMCRFRRGRATRSSSPCKPKSPAFTEVTWTCAKAPASSA